MGRNAILSRWSAPPICISVVTSGVWQRRIGRPAGFADTLGLPGSFSSTKRFMNARRAGGVMRENASLLRAVRKRTNSVWFWEQAAASTVFNAALGPPLFDVSLSAPEELPFGLLPVSCAGALAAVSRIAQITTETSSRAIDFAT